MHFFLFVLSFIVGRKENLPQINTVVAVAAALLILTTVTKPESIAIVVYMRKSQTPYTLIGKANLLQINNPECEFWSGYFYI